MCKLDNGKRQPSASQLRRLKKILLQGAEPSNPPSDPAAYALRARAAREVALENSKLLREDFNRVFLDACRQNKAHLFLLLYEDFLTAARQVLRPVQIPSPTRSTVRDYLQSRFFERMESKEEALWGRVEMLRTQLKKNSLCVSPKRRGKSLNARQASNLKKKLENLEASARDLGKKILSRSATDSELIKISKEGLGPLLPRRRTNNREQVLDLDAVMPESKPTPFNFDQYWSNILSERNPDPYEPGLDESDPAGIESLPKVNISIDESINTQFTIGVEFEASLFDQVESLHYRSAAALFCPNDHSKKALKVDATGLFLCRCFMPKGWTFFQFSAKNKDGGTFDYPIYFIDKTGKAEVPGQSGKPQEHWVHEYSDLHDLFAAAAAVRSKNAASKTASKRVTKGTSKPKRAR